MIRSRPLVWDTVTTTGWSTLGKAVGFMIPFFIAAWFGVTSDTDAFVFAYGLILFLSNIFAPVVENVIVPFIAEARKNGQDVGRFIGNVLGIGSIGLLILAAAALLVVRPVLSVVTDFDPLTLDLIYSLLLETSPLVLLLVWTSILNGTLNAYKKFVFPAVSPAFRAIINIGIIFSLRDQMGVHAIALGYVVGELSRLLILLGVIRWLRLFKLRISFHFTVRLRNFFKTASYQTLGMVAVWFKPIVDRSMASWLAVGSVSVLYYADRLYIIPITFIATGLMATTLSHWSIRHYESGATQLAGDVKRVVIAVGLITVFITVLLMILRRPIISLAYGRGAITPDQLNEVGRVWFYYLLGLPFYIVARIYIQAHLVLKNTRFLMIYAFGLNGLGVIGNYLLMNIMGVSGIALSTSSVTVLSAVFLSYMLTRKLKEEREISSIDEKYRTEK
jgi:putative peptidoglycan lipid II flippase